MSRCPKCRKSPLNGTELICDNDCGTVFCEFCRIEWYQDSDKVVTGHAPWCGNESDSDYVDSENSESSDEVSESDEEFDSREEESN